MMEQKYLLISPLLKVSSLSSAASKLYSALTFRGSFAGVAELTPLKFVDGYNDEEPPAAADDLGEPDVSFNESSIALTIWSSSSCDWTTLGSLLKTADFLSD